MPVDIAEGVRLIQEGIKAAPALTLPPQLEGLTDEDLDNLVKTATSLKNSGEIPDINILVKDIRDAKGKIYIYLC